MKMDQLKSFEANGDLPIKLGWNGGFLDFSIRGGPYDNFKRGVNGDFGVCVRAERTQDADYDVLLPIADFSVPAPGLELHVRDALKDIIDAALDRKTVWVGCMGGWGRTGLFLALLAKACGIEDPIGYVRKHYTPRAVETHEQVSYVQDFDVTEVRNWLWWRGWVERWERTFFWYARPD